LAVFFGPPEMLGTIAEFFRRHCLAAADNSNEGALAFTAVDVIE
jgi:hypothetical protein